MKKKVTALGLVLVLALSGCGDTLKSGNKSVGDCADGGSNCVTTIMYKGKPLHCITWTGYGSEVGLSCDFVEYHESAGGQF